MAKNKPWWAGMSANDISINLYGVVKSRHSPPEWAVFTELRGGTCYGGNREKMIDVVAIRLWRNPTQQVVVYEIKASRQDFMNEIKDPHKRQYAESISTDAYFAVPVGLLDPSEVPEPWGLIEAQKGGRSVIRKICTQRKLETWPWHQIQALARATDDGKDPVQLNPYWYLSGRRLTLDDLRIEFDKIHKDVENDALARGRKEGAQERMESYDYKEMLNAKQAIIDLCGYSARYHLAQSLRDWAAEQKTAIPRDIRRSLELARDQINNLLKET